MRVEVTFDVSADLSEAAARAAAEAALAHGGRDEGQLDVILVSDEALAELHGRFLQDSSVTDVMSFDLSWYSQTTESCSSISNVLGPLITIE